MRIFVYEAATGGGFLGGARLPAEFVTEGNAMWRAVTSDLCALEGVSVVTIRSNDIRPIRMDACEVMEVDNAESRDILFRRCVKSADWTLVIAPETDGMLMNDCRQVIDLGGRLLGPGLATVRIASDKQATAELLEAKGVPVPRGGLLAPGWWGEADQAHRVVVKPRDGAGSVGVQCLPTHTDVETRVAFDGTWRWECFHAGTSVSVGVICGRDWKLPLVPCRQRICDDEGFAYLGGALPLDDELSTRAIALAERVVEALPDPFGYVGIDMVLGANTDGGEDVVIEVNPRLTTSYVGVRAAVNERNSDTNLAGALLSSCKNAAPELAFRGLPIEFDADGTVRKS